MLEECVMGGRIHLPRKCLPPCDAFTCGMPRVCANHRPPMRTMLRVRCSRSVWSTSCWVRSRGHSCGRKQCGKYKYGCMGVEHLHLSLQAADHAVFESEEQRPWANTVPQPASSLAPAPSVPHLDGEHGSSARPPLPHPPTWSANTALLLAAAVALIQAGKPVKVRAGSGTAF